MSGNGKDLKINSVNDNFSKGKLYNLLVSSYASTQLNLRKDNSEVDLIDLKEAAEEMFEQLALKDPAQLMLMTQMLSIHNLQQELLMYANNTDYTGPQPYYINTATKLSNLFVSQATLFHKMRNGSSQDIAKDVHVHNGGQAVVGTVNCYPGKDKENEN